MVEWARCFRIAGGVFLAGQTEGNLGVPNAGIDDIFVARSVRPATSTVIGPHRRRF